MIGLDSNILVRYLAQDDPVQSPKATGLIERRLSEAAPGFVSEAGCSRTLTFDRKAPRLPGFAPP
jgi:predicted nucleic-acid-binding protein